MRRISIVLLILVLCSSGRAFAQERQVGEVNTKNLPRGVSETEARKLLEAAETGDDAETKALRAKRQNLLKQLNAITASARTAFRRVLQADKSGTYQQYLKDVERASLMKDGAERKKAFQSLSDRYLAFFEASFRSARINEADLKAKISRLVPGAKFGPLLTVYGREPVEPENEDKLNHARFAPDTLTFEAPYSIRSTKKQVQGISAGDATARATLEDGTMAALIGRIAGIGNGFARATLGQAVNVPSGVAEIKATVDLKNDYELIAVAIVAVSGAWADATIQVVRPDGTTKSKKQNLGFVLAIVGWDSRMNGEDEPLALSRRTGVTDPDDRQFQVKARIRAEAYSYGILGVAMSFETAELRKITVQTFN